MRIKLFVFIKLQCCGLCSMKERMTFKIFNQTKIYFEIIKGKINEINSTSNNYKTIKSNGQCLL
jgi:hypothetical protein